jgi:cyclopropane fatty-acyl-phospholipid synthase-like methyltransferase
MTDDHRGRTDIPRGQVKIPVSEMHRDFNAAYDSAPPWDIGRPQPAFTRLAESGVLAGSVLDVGCGTGEHALLAASRGLTALGIDIAPRAIDLARDKASERGLESRFRVWDALDLPGLGEVFDTVLDCGLFHVFDDEQREHYVSSLRTAIPVGGRYLMLCFSDRQPGEWGPRRVAQDEIRASFADGWRVDSIQPAVIDITIDASGAQAWLSVITRT